MSAPTRSPAVVVVGPNSEFSRRMSSNLAPVTAASWASSSGINGAIDTAWWNALVYNGNRDNPDDHLGWSAVVPIGPAQTFLPGTQITAVSRQSQHMDLFAIASDGSLRWTWWDANYNGGGWLHPTGLYTATTLFQISSSNEFIPGAAVAATVPNHNFIVLAAFHFSSSLTCPHHPWASAILCCLVSYST